MASGRPRKPAETGDERPYVPRLYETRYLPIEETMIYGAFIEWPRLLSTRPTGRYILVRQLDPARDLAYGYQGYLLDDFVTRDRFCLVDMRELKEEKHWTPLLDWKCCKLNDAIEIVGRRLKDLGPVSDGLFG
jgi:hypothetical protein